MIGIRTISFRRPEPSHVNEATIVSTSRPDQRAGPALQPRPCIWVITNTAQEAEQEHRPARRARRMFATRVPWTGDEQLQAASTTGSRAPG